MSLCRYLLSFIWPFEFELELPIPGSLASLQQWELGYYNFLPTIVNCLFVEGKSCFESFFIICQKILLIYYLSNFNFLIEMWFPMNLIIRMLRYCNSFQALLSKIFKIYINYKLIWRLGLIYKKTVIKS